MNIPSQLQPSRGAGPGALEFAQPPGGYGPPGGAPPGGGGWGPPPGGAPPGGAPPGGWGPPPGGAPPGGAPPGGWGPPGGGPPGGAPPGGGGGWGPPPGGAPPGGRPPGGAPPGGPPGAAPPGGPPGWGPPPGGAPPGGWGPPGGGGGYGQPPGGYGPPGGHGAPPGGFGAPPGGYAPPPGGYGPPPGVYAPPQAYASPAGGRPTFSPGDAITFAWERIKADAGTILGAIIVAMLIVFVLEFTVSFAIGLLNGAVGVASSVAVGGRQRIPQATAVPVMLGFNLALQAVSFVVNLGISSFFGAGIVNFSLKVAKGAPYAFGDVFGGGRYFLSVVVAQIISTLAIMIGFVLLIVPGVIVALGLSMTQPLIVDRNLGPIDALTESWKLTDGNRVNIFIFGLIAGGLGIAGFCACGVGILLVVPLLCIAYAFVYLRLTGQPVAQVGRAA